MAALNLILVGVNPAYDGVETHFYGQLGARMRPQLPVADA